MPESASEKFDSFEKDEVMVQNYQMTKSMNQVIFDNQRERIEAKKVVEPSPFILEEEASPFTKAVLAQAKMEVNPF